MKLGCNVGIVDRIARFALGILLAVAFFGGYATGALGIVALAASAIMFATGAIGFCPIYAVFGIRTCPVQRS